MESKNGVLVVAGVLHLASTGPGALSFDSPREADFAPCMLWDFDFMSIHEGRDGGGSRVGETSA